MSKQINTLFNFGKRNSNAKYSQMRMQCSKLNVHLFNHHVTDFPSCICVHYIEDNEHYLLHCPLYVVHKNKMLQTLQTNINVQDFM